VAWDGMEAVPSAEVCVATREALPSATAVVVDVDPRGGALGGVVQGHQWQRLPSVPAAEAGAPSRKQRPQPRSPRWRMAWRSRLGPCC
jgi:hypothetical protein